MPTALYDEVFSVPVAYERPKAKVLDCPIAEELEFSEFGRSSTIPAGWYLAPALLIVPLAILAFLFL